MAIIDNTLVFSDQQAITATANSTNVIDLLAPGTPYGYSSALTKDVGIGKNIPVLVEVTTAFATLTSLTVSMQVATDAAFTSPVTVATTNAIPVASLVAGYRFLITEIPQGTNKQFVRLVYTVAGSNATAGKIFAGIRAGDQTA